MLITTGGKGQGLVEYALILVFIAIVVIATLLIHGPKLAKVFTHISVCLPNGQCL